MTTALQRCEVCFACHASCSICPTPCQKKGSFRVLNKDRIWNRVRMPSSQYRLRLKAMNVSKMVGQSACPTHLEQAGGPGDLQKAIQDSGRGACGTSRVCTYNPGHIKARLSYNNKSGVDRKHGSYARYLARRVGGELRKEMMPYVKMRTANRHQPRNRTNTMAHYGKKTNKERKGGYCCKETTSDCCADKRLFEVVVGTGIAGVNPSFEFIGWHAQATQPTQNDIGHKQVVGECHGALSTATLNAMQIKEIGWQADSVGPNYTFKIGFSLASDARSFAEAVGNKICLSSSLGSNEYILYLNPVGEQHLQASSGPLPPWVRNNISFTLSTGSCSPCCTNRIPSMESCDCLPNRRFLGGIPDPNCPTKFAFTGRHGHDSSCVSICCGATNSRP
jgi:hypothetical protein